MTAFTKLQSLQGLRGISILLVIIFHLFPKKFTNGFVGVDMFFVLSGYLMARILSKEITVKSTLDFFKKRFNRVVPLYYSTILATILGILTLVLRTERSDFLLDLKWCLSLSSNIQPIFEHHSYWQQVSSIRYLTHLWSLATELQYYLLAPFIHLIASKMGYWHRILGYSVLIAGSFLFQVSTPIELSYSFPVSRIWQFLLGSVSFEVSRKSDEEKKLAENEYIENFPVVFMLVLSMTFLLPSEFGEMFTRIVMSVAAAILCCYCGQLEGSFFTTQPLVYIGDLSYVIYLVHWPIINFVRYIQQRDHSSLDIYEAAVALVLITVISLMAHYFLEKKLIHFSFLTNFTMTVFVFGVCCSSIPLIQNTQCLAIKTLSPELIETAEFNLDDRNLLRNVSDLPCHQTEKNAGFLMDMASIEYCSHMGNDTGKVLIIGNSVAVRAFPHIFRIFIGNYEEIRLFARHGAAPLLNNFPSYNKAALAMARDLKPDLIWIIQGMNEIRFQSKSILKHFPPRVITRVAQQQIDQFKNLTSGRVYVDLPYYITAYRPAKLIARSLIYRKNMDKKLSVSQRTVEKQIGEQRRRLRSLDCRNCEFIDVQKALTLSPHRFSFYEPHTFRALNYDGSHLSLSAYQYVGPVYQKKIERFIQEKSDTRSPK